MINPCLDCPDRSAECHAHCERYAEWNAAHLAAKSKYIQRRAADDANISAIIKEREKRRRRLKK